MNPLENQSSPHALPADRKTLQMGTFSPRSLQKPAPFVMRKRVIPGVVRSTLWPLLAAPDCHPKKYGLKRGDQRGTKPP